MEKYVTTKDGIRIHYQFSQAGPNAIVFVHGWLGNSDWWNHQREYFKTQYTIVQIDLTGHGKSEERTNNWSSSQYAKDIKDVVGQFECENIVLVGHSMSGPYVLEASLIIPKTKLVILVDTLKNTDQIMTYEQADDFILKSYRKDFANAVKNLLPKFLFAEFTPIAIRKQLQKEFLKTNPAFAVKSIEPLYKMNIRKVLKSVNVPVRAINSDFTPTHIDTIRRYLKDFDYREIPKSGHYPMLEQPNQFNLLLSELLQKTPGDRKHHDNIAHVG